jgi:hypothetical protein
MLMLSFSRTSRMNRSGGAAVRGGLTGVAFDSDVLPHPISGTESFLQILRARRFGISV